MKEALISLIVFVFIYLFYLFFVILHKKKLDKFKENMYVKYLVNVYHLDLKNIKFKNLANTVALTNSFILALVLYVVSITDEIVLQALLAIAVFIPLQIVCYHIIGKIYQKKGRD